MAALPSTAGPQLLYFFISHWWGETVNDFITCLEQAIRGFSINGENEDNQRRGGVTMDTPAWVCTYANNQWELSGDIPDDPKESGYTEAMQVAENCTIIILDKEAIVFERV